MITWDVNPEIFRLGAFALRWYSLFFMVSFILGLRIMQWVFTTEKKPEKALNDLFIYVFLGTIIGARLGHCLFYDPAYYLSHPLEIVQVWRGGLASHGAVIGILLALYLLAKKWKQLSFLWIVDRIAITVPLAGFFIRLGNLFNSEILGKPADVSWAVIFTRVDAVPRHPAQLYESFAYLLIFLLLFSMYRKKKNALPEGLLFGLFLACVFTARFFIEFFKENQSGFEAGLVLNMGQMLGLPFMLLGAYFIFRSRRSLVTPPKETA